MAESSKKQAQQIGNYKIFHTDDNLTYYYNVKTKVSTWEKPPELCTAEEKSVNSNWKQFKTKDGKTYYYNVVTKESRWSLEDKDSTVPSVQNSSAGTKESRWSLEDKVSTVKPVQDSSTKESFTNISPPLSNPSINIDIKAANLFKSLLEKKGIKSNFRWESALPIIITDRLYSCLPNLAQKKQIFQQYTEELSHKTKISEEKELFYKILEDKIDLVLSGIPFWDALPFLETDSRFNSVALDDKTKEELFYYYKCCNDNKNKSGKNKKELVANFIALLKKQPGFTCNSHWRDISELIKHEPAYLAIESNNERQDIFDDVRREIRKNEAEKKLLKEKEFSEKLRSFRENYLAILQYFTSKFQITTRTKWEDALQLLENNSNEFSNLKFPSDLPEESLKSKGYLKNSNQLTELKNMYQMFIDDLSAKLEPIRHVVKPIVHSFFPIMSGEEKVDVIFDTCNSHNNQFEKIENDFFVRLVIAEMIQKTSQRIRHQEKKQRIVEKHFNELLHKFIIDYMQSYPNTNIQDITIDTIKDSLLPHASYQFLPEEIRQQLLFEYVNNPPVDDEINPKKLRVS